MSEAEGSPPEVCATTSSDSTATSTLVPCLSCSICREPICCSDDLLREPHPSLKEACYQYQIDLLDVSDVCCYSTMNPQDVRFDVVRVATGRLSQRVALYGEPTPEYSWFPPFFWSMVDCSRCEAHLGWAFHPPLAPSGAAPTSKMSGDEADTGGNRCTESSPSVPVGSDDNAVESTTEEGVGMPFLGLILTKLRERQCLATHFDGGALDMKAGSRQSRTGFLRRLLSGGGTGTDNSAAAESESEAQNEEDGHSD